MEQPRSGYIPDYANDGAECASHLLQDVERWSFRLNLRRGDSEHLMAIASRTNIPDLHPKHVKLLPIFTKRLVSKCWA
jgi:hypothetical protein